MNGYTASAALAAALLLVGCGRDEDASATATETAEAVVTVGPENVAVATVAELVAEARDPGAPELLAAYEARRRGERGRVSGFTDALVRIFSNSIPGLADARHWGLLALDLLPLAKQEVIRQNIGFAGSTPAVARK